MGDILPVKIVGRRSHTYNAWDILVTWTGVTDALMDLAMHPEYVHKMLRRLTDDVLKREERLAAIGVLDAPQPRFRVGNGSSGYTNDLPKDPRPMGSWTMADHWGSATSQIFAEVSPDMHEEFALDYEREILDQCGLNYYGCCESLHNKMHLMNTLPKLRKVSISPWCDTAKAYANTEKLYVFSHKPNPAVFATDTFQPEKAREEIRQRPELSQEMPCELVAKDISTCRKDPQRLIQWTQIAMEEAEAKAVTRV